MGCWLCHTNPDFMIEKWTGELEIRILLSIKICINWIRKKTEQINKQPNKQTKTSIQTNTDYFECDM